MSFNKTITTNVIEQVKTVLLVALVTGIVAFLAGVNYQRNAKVTVENKVVLNSQVTPAEVPEVKK